MMDELFGNSTASKVLLYLARFGEGYPTGIAKNFGISQSMVQTQMEKLELGGVLVSTLKGRTRVYTLNPMYPLKQELLALLKKAFLFMQDKTLKAYYTKRTRPRRKGKP